jgi:AdoMet-dependent rRNA methyltransferase SPB1
VRHREGYEEGISLAHRALSALAFVASESPVEMLGQYTHMVLEGPDAVVLPDGIKGGQGCAAALQGGSRWLQGVCAGQAEPGARG